MIGILGKNTFLCFVARMFHNLKGAVISKTGKAIN